MTRQDYTAITELPNALLTPDQMRRFAHRYGYAHRLAKGQRLLEVACGAGAGLNYLAENASQVVGMDYTSGVLGIARQNTDAPLVQGDAQHLPFAAASFDLILCFEAIYYLEDYRRFLTECHRVLTPAGKLLICQSNPDWPNFVPGNLTTRYPSLPEVASALGRGGFNSVTCSGTLPITALTPRQQAINTLRRWVLQSGILPRLGPLKRLLQRLSYRELHPLPHAINGAWVATWQAALSLAPLSPTHPDRIHRVLYFEAAK
jgi:ubiquinone/menaquinone biosynthesis C-methylase UbiE